MAIFDVFKGKSDMEIAGDNQVDELDKGKVKEFDLNIEKILENWENYRKRLIFRYDRKNPRLLFSSRSTLTVHI